MSKFTFDDFALATLGGAKNTSDGSPLSMQQKQEVISYLRSPQSGPDGVTSFADYVATKMQAHPPELPAGTDYLGFSATDRSGKLNFDHAKNYAKDVNGSAGIIGDTPWGRFIDEMRTDPLKHPEFQIMERGLERFMNAQGTEPWGGNHRGALQDVMWNAGSPTYFENAIATNRPLVAFVDGAMPGRGFDKFELATALDHPTVRINGYPISAFGPDPLTFASQSAAEYQTLERTLAQHATTNTGQAVDVAQVRLHLKPIDGYDAMGKTLFEKPLHDYSALSLHEMSTTRAEWVAARSALSTGPRLFADLPEPLPHSPMQPGAPRGPPGVAVAEAVPHGVNPGMKALGVAGVALMAHDFATSGHKWVELNSQGNTAGADSTSAHFVGRNLGGALGGFAAGAGIGLVSGSWSGPGAVVAGIAGGALGAHLGEQWAAQKDIERVYIQQDPLHRTWTRSPADPEGRWLRSAEQQQVQSADLGTGVEVRPVQTAQGADVTFKADYVATGTLERQLNWQAARASYELGLANLPPPQNPYRLNASGLKEPPPSAFETGREFVRDTVSRQWELEIREVVDGRTPITRRESVPPEREPALDEQSRTVIAQNAANTPASVASRYMVAHEQGRWSDFGDAQNPSVPQAIRKAQDGADTLRASDGRSYSRHSDGQWVHDGVAYDTQANRNIGDELEITWQSQNAGIADMGRMAEQIKATVHIAPEGVRGQVETLYAKHGIPRTEEQLAATTAAVEQKLADVGRQTDITLELMPDPRTHAPSADSAIASFGTAPGNRMELTSTTTVEDMVRMQSAHGAPSPALPQMDGQQRERPFVPAVGQEPERPAHAVHGHAGKPVEEPQTAGSPLLPGHPDYPLYEQIRDGVSALDAKHGRSFDAISERMSASLLVLAKDSDLSRVDHVVLSNATAQTPAGHTVFLVQGELNDPSHLRSSMPTGQAVQTPVEQSLQRYESVSQEAQQRAMGRELEQQSQEERMQQEVRGRAASMG
ncbi:XVIPCD domain-containing protein [Stenotrophomonas sp. B1-1]|uniref:XVIPCD domain-containing protein n=1 Tax=Stenotrophomonas sp. B1-1 TaxID=2710648 RepID=UPI0013D90F10|nr:XVIPCD domain-containing protein [Stenotrophomonas sp. B1-1]